MAENINPTSEMDSSNPFFLHHSDNPGAIIISKPLNSENYNSWKKDDDDGFISQEQTQFC
jgi:hypothetical protein